MITKAEQDEMREYARFFVRTEREDLEKMRRGDRPEEEEQVMPPPEMMPDELEEPVPGDMNNIPPPGRV